MNEALKLIDEVVGKEGFTIDNDNAAEWALTKLAEEKAELQRMINVCNTKISEYQYKIQQLQEKYNNKTSYLTTQLHMYFETVPLKETKTQKTYKLPSGTLRLKKQNPEFVRDDEKLIQWCKNTGAAEFVKVKETLDWASLKDGIRWTKNGKAVDGDGQIIDGVTKVDRPDKFEIDI